MFWDRVWRWVDVDVGGAGVWSRSGWNPREGFSDQLSSATLILLVNHHIKKSFSMTIALQNLLKNFRFGHFPILCWRV